LKHLYIKDMKITKENLERVVSHGNVFTEKQRQSFRNHKNKGYKLLGFTDETLEELFVKKGRSAELCSQKEVIALEKIVGDLAWYVLEIAKDRDEILKEYLDEIRYSSNKVKKLIKCKRFVV
jgi:hypothetical protein